MYSSEYCFWPNGEPTAANSGFIPNLQADNQGTLTSVDNLKVSISFGVYLSDIPTNVCVSERQWLDTNFADEFLLSCPWLTSGERWYWGSLGCVPSKASQQ